MDFDDPRANLAFRNLVRARGEAGDRAADGHVPQGKASTSRVTRAQIRNGSNGATWPLTATQLGRLSKDTPLWFYILREAG